MKYGWIVIPAAALMIAGCVAGPNYRRPTLQVPESFRAPAPLPAPEAASLADLKWWEVFHDDQLQQLVRTALQQNYDVREAVSRVDAARASLGSTRSNQFPQIGASGDIEFTRLSRDGSFRLPASLVPSQNRNWGRRRSICFRLK